MENAINTMGTPNYATTVRVYQKVPRLVPLVTPSILQPLPVPGSPSAGQSAGMKHRNGEMKMYEDVWRYEDLKMLILGIGKWSYLMMHPQIMKEMLRNVGICPTCPSKAGLQRSIPQLGPCLTQTPLSPCFSWQDLYNTKRYKKQIQKAKTMTITKPDSEGYLSKLKVLWLANTVCYGV